MGRGSIRPTSSHVHDLPLKRVRPCRTRWVSGGLGAFQLRSSQVDFRAIVRPPYFEPYSVVRACCAKLEAERGGQTGGDPGLT